MDKENILLRGYKMTEYTFEEIEAMLLECIRRHGCEAELRLTFADRPHEYIFIVYDGHCSFQRCGTEEEQSGEYDYPTLDELYRARQTGDIVLERDWHSIRSFDCMDFDISGIW